MGVVKLFDSDELKIYEAVSRVKPFRESVVTKNSEEFATKADDVSLRPGPNADSQEEVAKYISSNVIDLYDVYSYRHAAAILSTSFPQKLKEIETALLNFRMTKRDIGIPGGNESVIPKRYADMLRPGGWQEARVQGDLHVKLKMSGESLSHEPVTIIENFIDGHKIDFVKGRVAFDLEWNSKDQTFDRDLYAMRAFHECGLISLGVMLTRSEKLNPIFRRIPQLKKDGTPVYAKNGELVTVHSKYGASTTWMGKLLYRLNAGRHGGCPVLVFGITPKLISDYDE